MAIFRKYFLGLKAYISMIDIGVYLRKSDATITVTKSLSVS